MSKYSDIVKKSSTKIVVAMSGGVDSSTVAGMLKNEGYDVSGIVLRLWPSANDDTVQGAQKIADFLEIPLQVKDFGDLFQEHVIDNFIGEYESGLTPNPCVICNKKIKFGALLNESIDFGADFLATGHYVKKIKLNDRYAMLKGIDQVKDQSYFLYRLNQQQLSRLMFPLGEYEKSEVREKAREYGLPVADKKESQDLCFIDDMDYRKFLSLHSSIKFKEGIIRDVSGKKLGIHKGLQNYTIGQRRGLGVSGGEPLYVTKLDVKNNELIVGNNKQRGSDVLYASQVNYVSGIIPEEDFSALVKIRYTSLGVNAVVTPLPNAKIKIKFEKPLLDITPGQSAVFYEENQIIGGGVIDR